MEPAIGCQPQPTLQVTFAFLEVSSALRKLEGVSPNYCTISSYSGSFDSREPLHPGLFAGLFMHKMYYSESLRGEKKCSLYFLISQRLQHLSPEWKDGGGVLKLPPRPLNTEGAKRMGGKQSINQSINK